MDSEKLEQLLADLEGTLTHLEDVVKPLTSQDLRDTSSKLPLLDEAKLNVLSFSAIESLIFSAMKVNGIDAKKHPVHEELMRGKRYNEKIKDVEEGNITEPQKQQPRHRLDKAAAQRFVKHVIGGVAAEKGDVDSEQTPQSTGKKRKRAGKKDRDGQKNKQNREDGVVQQPGEDQDRQEADDGNALDKDHGYNIENDKQATKSSDTTSASAHQHHPSKRSKQSLPTETSPHQDWNPAAPSAGASSQQAEEESQENHSIKNAGHNWQKDKRNRKAEKSKRSHNAPRSNHAVFKDLLERGKKEKSDGGSDA